MVVASAAPPDEDGSQSPPVDQAPDHRPRSESRSSQRPSGDDAGLIHRDNTFGTPEEDAFRRDFTINGLFYDIASRSVIDYVGGLDDLEHRVIRSIGDPRVRFVEDPVRMVRAAVFAARLGFDMDALVSEAIAEHRTLILKASPARMLEEVYKILRSGAAEASFRALSRVRLLELIVPDLKSPADAVWDAPGAARSVSAAVPVGAARADERRARRCVAGAARPAPAADPRRRPRSARRSTGVRHAADFAKGSRAAAAARADAATALRPEPAAASGSRAAGPASLHRRRHLARGLRRRAGDGRALETGAPPPAGAGSRRRRSRPRRRARRAA